MKAKANLLIKWGAIILVAYLVYLYGKSAFFPAGEEEVVTDPTQPAVVHTDPKGRSNGGTQIGLINVIHPDRGPGGAATGGSIRQTINLPKGQWGVSYPNYGQAPGYSAEQFGWLAMTFPIEIQVTRSGGSSAILRQNASGGNFYKMNGSVAEDLGTSNYIQAAIKANGLVDTFSFRFPLSDGTLIVAMPH